MTTQEGNKPNYKAIVDKAIGEKPNLVKPEHNKSIDIPAQGLRDVFIETIRDGTFSGEFKPTNSINSQDIIYLANNL